MRLKLRLVLFCVAAAFAGGCSNSNKQPEDNSAQHKDSSAVYGRYLENCLQRGPVAGNKTYQLFCKCMYESARRNYSEPEMELVIARVSGDKDKEKEITSRPDFDAKQFAAKASEIKNQAVSCAMSQGGN